MWGCREWGRQTQTSLTICLLIPLAFIKIAWGGKKGKKILHLKRITNFIHKLCEWSAPPISEQSLKMRIWDADCQPVPDPWQLCIQMLCTLQFMGKFLSRAAASCQYWPFTVKGFKNNFIEPAVCRAEGPHSGSDPQSQLPSLLQQGVPCLGIWCWTSSCICSFICSSQNLMSWLQSDWNCPRWFCQKHIRECTDELFSQHSLMSNTAAAAGGDTAGEGNQHRAGGHCPQKLFKLKTSQVPLEKTQKKPRKPQATHPKKTCQKVTHAN